MSDEAIAAPDPPGLPPRIGHLPAARAEALNRSTVIVREDVIYRFRGEQREVADGRHAFSFAGGDEVLTRVVPVGPDWTPLARHWVEQPSVVWLENQVGFDRQTIPTPAEEAAENGLVIEVGVGPPPAAPNPFVAAFARIRPGRCCRFEPVPLGPAHGTALWVRCPNGTAEFRVVLVPGPPEPGDA